MLICFVIVFYNTIHKKSIGDFMLKVSNEELSKIAQFVSSCDDMINGKFLFADVKIKKILNMIADSEELYRYVSGCLVGYDFSKEYYRSKLKNGLNGGFFAAPAEQSKLVAYVFCLLVECDSRRIDLYAFINENFPSQSRTESYSKFASKLLIPFKEIIASHFGFNLNGEIEVQNLTEQYRQDLHSEPVFEENNDIVNYENVSFENFSNNINQNSNGYVQQNYGAEQPSLQNFEFNGQIQNDYQNKYESINQNAQSQFVQSNTQNGFQPQFNSQNAQNDVNYEIPVPNFQSQIQDEKKNDIWADICDICANVESSVYAERHLKQYLKEELLYILSTIKYATKYKDVKIISALVTAFDELSKKFRSIQFVFGELKNKMQSLY